MKRLLAGALWVLLSSCASGAGGDCPAGEGWDDFGERCRRLLPERSREGGGWKKGETAFVEATSKWGLEALEVEGVRLSVADVDGDGWPDLSARRAGSQADDFGPGGSRGSWLLRNRAGAGFDDITESSGFVAPRQDESGKGRPVEVVVWADVNNDGAVDAFTGITPAPGSEHRSELMLNDGAGRFHLAPDGFLPPLGPASVGGATFLDVDRDGWIDLFVGHGAGPGGLPEQDRLFWNDQGKTFLDITEGAGLATRAWSSASDLDQALGHSNAWGAAACDLDGDGFQEILVSSYGRAPNHLWVGREGASFENHSIASGYAFDHRMDWTDNESARCHCHLNPGDADCGGVPPPSLIRCEVQEDAFRWNHANDRRPFRLGGNSATTVCADLDGDGFLDLLTTEIVHWDVGSSSDPSEILLNEGSSPPAFRRPGNEATGLTRERDSEIWDDGDMTAAVFDFDNDGRPDVYIGSSDYPGTRGRLYWQGEDGRFVPVPPVQGIDHQSSHGIAVADFDRDGDLDVVVGHSRTRCGDHCYEKGTVRFFENRIGEKGNWIQIDLRGGEGSNRSAIGARVEVRAGERLQVQEVGGGHGHYGIQHDRVLHFGLGAAREALVTVRWPDRKSSIEKATLQSGYRFLWKQGAAPSHVP